MRMREIVLAAVMVVAPMSGSSEPTSPTSSTFYPLCQEVVSGVTVGVTTLPCATPTKGDNYAVTVLLPDNKSFTTRNYTPVLESLWEGAYVATGFMVQVPVGTPIPDPNPPAMTEDDPQWDCEKMGNRVCGPHGSRPKVSGER